MLFYKIFFERKPKSFKWIIILIFSYQLVRNDLASFEVACKQCDQIRLYLKGLGAKFAHKSSPNIWQIFAVFKNISFKLKLLLLLLLLGHFGYFYFSMWSHCVWVQAIFFSSLSLLLEKVWSLSAYLIRLNVLDLI